MAKEKMKQRTHDGVDKIMDKAESMKESSVEAIASLKERGMEMKENMDKYIRKNPEKSVLIAAGTGAVVGAILAALFIRRR